MKNEPFIYFRKNDIIKQQWKHIHVRQQWLIWWQLQLVRSNQKIN